MSFHHCLAVSRRFFALRWRQHAEPARLRSPPTSTAGRGEKRAIVFSRDRCGASSSSARMTQRPPWLVGERPRPPGRAVLVRGRYVSRGSPAERSLQKNLLSTSRSPSCNSGLPGRTGHEHGARAGGPPRQQRCNGNIRPCFPVPTETEASSLVFRI